MEFICKLVDTASLQKQAGMNSCAFQAALSAGGVKLGIGGMAVTDVRQEVPLTPQTHGAVYSGFMDVAVHPIYVKGASILELLEVAVELKQLKEQRDIYMAGMCLSGACSEMQMMANLSR